MWFYIFFTNILGDNLILKTALTDQTNGIKISRETNVLRFSRYNGAAYQKLYYNMVSGEFDSITAIGLNKFKSLGTYLSNSLAGVAAIVLFSEVSKERYLINSVYLQPRCVNAGLIAGAQDLQLAINGVDVTGGVISVGFGDLDNDADMGVNVAGTAITALNQVEVGDTVTLNLVAGGTGFTADQFASFEVIADITKN